MRLVSWLPPPRDRSLTEANVDYPELTLNGSRSFQSIDSEPLVRRVRCPVVHVNRLVLAVSPNPAGSHYNAEEFCHSRQILAKIWPSYSATSKQGACARTNSRTTIFERLLAFQPQEEPSLCRAPIAVDTPAAHRQRLGDFGNGQTAKKTHFHDFGLTLVDLTQFV